MVSKKSSRSVPTGVKVISVLYYIGAAIGVLLSLALILGAEAISRIVADNAGLAAISRGAVSVMGIVVLALGVLAFFIGRGLWKRQKWARIAAIILAVLGLLDGLLALLVGVIGSGAFNIIVNGLVGWYLRFNKRVKAAF